MWYKSERLTQGVKRMSRDKNKGGRLGQLERQRYTAHTVIQILSAIERGAPVKLACQAAGIPVTTYQSWRSVHPDFAAQVDKARATYKLGIINTVSQCVNGVECGACEYGVYSITDPDTDLVTGAIECPACKGTGYVTKPDGKLGLKLLGKIAPEHYDPVTKVDHQVTSTVELTGGVTHQHIPLAQLEPAQLAQLAWGGQLEVFDDDNDDTDGG